MALSLLTLINQWRDLTVTDQLLHKTDIQSMYEPERRMSALSGSIGESGFASRRRDVVIISVLPRGGGT